MSRGRPLGLVGMVVGGLLVGGLVVGGAAFVLGLVGQPVIGDDPRRDAAAVGAPGGPRDQVDLGVFLDRWEASLTGTYVVEGTLTRRRSVSGQQLQQTVAFRHARGAGRVLEQLGDLATVVADGRTRDCQLFDGGEVACAADQPAPTPSELRAAMAAEMAGDYVVFETEDDRCLELVGTGPITIGRWGQSSVVCFDALTGAVVETETFTGSSATVLTADRVSGAPSSLDLEPG